jgi:hypothetical protein
VCENTQNLRQAPTGSPPMDERDLHPQTGRSSPAGHHHSEARLVEWLLKVGEPAQFYLARSGRPTNSDPSASCSDPNRLLDLGAVMRPAAHHLVGSMWGMQIPIGAVMRPAAHHLVGSMWGMQIPNEWKGLPRPELTA